ncbi:MAG: molybdopterin dinucleotide binding domain-containing protein, partial [Acidobacteriota bacterium]
TKPTGDAVLALAKTLGLETALPWTSYEEYLKFRVAGIATSGSGAVADAKVAVWKEKPTQTGYTDGADLWKKLSSGLCWYDAPTAATTSIGTPSGKVELACQGLQAVAADDADFLPHFVAPADQEKDLLLSAYRIQSLSAGYLATPPFMMKTVWDFILKGTDVFAQVSAKTAQSLGINEGDRAVLKSAQGEFPVRVNLSPAVPPGTVYLVHGLGHKAYDEYINGKGVNANNLVEVRMDPLTGLGAVGTTRAQLRRA